MNKVIIIWFVTILTFLLNSCENSTGNQKEHFQPEGWIFIDGTSSRFIQIFRGKFINESKIQFDVENGQKTDHIKIKFFDKNQQEIDVPEDSVYKLGWEIGDENIVELDRHDGEEWEFHLEGLAKGTTEIEFFVKHGDHNDVRSGKIKVVVE